MLFFQVLTVSTLMVVLPPSIVSQTLLQPTYSTYPDTSTLFTPSASYHKHRKASKHHGAKKASSNWDQKERPSNYYHQPEATTANNYYQPEAKISSKYYQPEAHQSAHYDNHQSNSYDDHHQSNNYDNHRPKHHDNHQKGHQEYTPQASHHEQVRKLICIFLNKCAIKGRFYDLLPLLKCVSI